MPKIEWFRKATWSHEDQEDFHRRLYRARRSSRAQYLRIQALHLQEAGLTTPALELLDRMLSEYPDDIQLAPALHQKASCMEDLARYEEAETAYRDALSAERALRTIKSGAWLDFGWFAINHGRSHLYQEVLAVLDEFQDRQLRFPVMRYKFHAIRAIVTAALGEHEEARTAAALALRAAQERHSGLHYHSTLGLVGNARGSIHEQLVQLAG